MKHNLLFITTDQQRFDSLRAYGFAPALTPNLDRLCSEGTLFENCYVTAPICVACRATMMTGLYPSTVGALGNGSWLEEFIPTWPGVAAQAGYRTAGIGKMHFAPWQVFSGFQERITCEDKRHYYIPDDHYQYLEKNGKKRLSPVRFPQYYESCGAPFYPYSKEFYPDVYVADQAVRWLGEHGAEPFAAWVSFIGPHDPYDPPEEYKDLYRAEDMPEPIPAPEDVSDKTSYRLCDQERPGRDNAVFQCDYMAATTAQKKYWRKNYMTNLSIIDEGIGRILRALEEQGLWEDTTIVFTSDHGDALGDHGMVFKSFFYEAMAHVPLIVKGPGVPKGERRSALVSTCDLVPYFYEVLGLTPPPAAQGCSIGKVLQDPACALHETVFSEMEGRYMAFDGRYKLVYHVGLPGELYDLQEDPQELTNRIGDPACQAARQRLTDALLAHLDGCNRQRTRLSKKVACEKRLVIDRLYKEGKEVADL